MTPLRFIRAVFTLAAMSAAALATPVHLRCEYMRNPLGLDASTPHLSWQSDSTAQNWKQAAYEVLVASNIEHLRAGKPDVWDSGKISSDESLGISYGGPALESRKRYYWKVRVWDSAGNASDSTEDAWWEMGLLHPEDWKAKWISWTNPDDESDRKNVHWIWLGGQNGLAAVPNAIGNFRLSVPLKDNPKSVILLLSVRGDYVAKVNGVEVDGKHRWGAFDRRDISDDLKVGDNLVEVRVTAPESDGNAKTSTAGIAALVKIIRNDGSVTRITTGENWDATPQGSTSWQPASITADLGDKRMGGLQSMPQPAAAFRRTIDVAKKVASARLYITALGSYRAFINGKPVTNNVLTPDFTDYRKRVFYQVYDVAEYLTEGKNQISALLGDGWYGSPLTWYGVNFFSLPDRFEAQLEITFADGSRDAVATDESWKASASPILGSQIYGGETYDARQEQPGWQSATFDDSHWSHASIAEAPAIAVTSQITEPVHQIDAVKPKSVHALPNGVYVVDMGQNMVGWVTLKVKGSAGTKVRMRFAEIVNPDGSIYTENLRGADSTDTYILKGGGQESFAPHFTFHGFRYVELTGYPGKPSLDSVTGNVVSSVAQSPSARLSTSSDLVNRMYEIGLWGQRGNFLSVPTDCPQRDERLGWMGDAGVFWRTGAYNFDVAAFSEKFIQDIVDAQTKQGAFTNVSPDTLPGEGGGTQEPQAPEESITGAPGWGDAGVIVPWTTWMQYGDKAVIEKKWDAMQRWMEFIQSRNPDYIRKNGVGPNFADWLAPDPNTDKDLLATAYWALIGNMMSQMAHALGKDADAKQYDELVANIRSAFQKAYIKEDGTVGTGTQTSYVVALYTKMAPSSVEPALTDKLVKDIESRNWHLSTGFLGTPFLLFTLSDHGHSDVAYRLLLNDTYPSWGYMLAKGATTWWERWNGDTGDPAMNSYNHYAFGSVVAWVYRYAAGIDTYSNAPGFKEIVIHPHLDPRMSSARAEYDSVYGKIVSDWKTTANGSFTLRVTIPANTSAKIYLPSGAGTHVTEDGKPIETQNDADSSLVRVGSGTYSFEVR